LVSTPSVLLPQVPDSVKDRYYAALKQIGQDNFEDGISELRSIILQYPGYSKPYRNLVETYIFIDQLDSAEVFFEDIITAHPENAYGRYALARIDFANKNHNSAIGNLKRCIELDPQFADAYSHRGGLPEVYRAQKDLDSAIRFFDMLVEQQPKNACAYYGLARSYIRKFQWQEALRMLGKALELDPEFTLAYHATIFAHFSQSRNRKVMELGEQLLVVANRVDDFEMSAYANMMIGTSHRRQGDYFNAISHLSEALRIAKSIGDKTREQASLNNLANVYLTSGSYSKALQYSTQALFLSRKTGNKLADIHNLSNIGHVYKVRGDNEEAMNYYKAALKVARESGYEDRESDALSWVANVLLDEGEHERAIAYQNQALMIAQELKYRSREGFALRSLGEVSQELEDHLEAIQHYQQALKIGQEIEEVQLIWESEAGLGFNFAKLGRQTEAVRHYSNAVALYDSVREDLDIESLGSSFLVEDQYEAHPPVVQLMAQRGEHRHAFVYAEKYKSKRLLDMLAQGQSLANTMLPDSARLQLTEIKAQLEKTHRKLSLERSKSKDNQQNTLSLEQAITDLELQKGSLIAELKRERNVYYEVTAPEILDVTAIQDRILSEGQAIIEYILGPESTSIFVITPDTLIYRQTPMNRGRLQGMLARLSPIFDWLGNAGEQELQPVINPQTADFSIGPAYALYEAVFKPIEPWLLSFRELIIVPDDLLFYLPFELLVFDTTRVETEYDFINAQFLLEKYAISYVSAASLLEPTLQRIRKPNKGILAVGNPDFGSQESKYTPSELLASKEPQVQSIATEPLLSLPQSEAEVRAIDEVFKSSENRILMGSDATETDLKNQAQGFGILHFATHFLPMDDQPLYSKIVLMEQDPSLEDGNLQTYEVFNLDLNADLVVLSACNTLSGKLRKGEGVISISRAFQYAGVPSLVASLWSVDDESTAYIMRGFYQYLKQGLKKNKALQLAKLDYLRSSSSYNRDPFYWAPFVLIGDQSPVHLPTQPRNYVWLFVIAIVITVSAAVLVRNRKRLRVSL
jgi:CHAT domain-containing protein/Tfp pilus assembly protein PilF